MKINLIKQVLLSTAIGLTAFSCTNEDMQPDTDDARVAVRISAEAGALQKTRATDDVWNENDVIGVTMVTPGTLNVIEPYRNYGYATSGDTHFSPNSPSEIIYFPTSDEEVTFRAYYPYQVGLSSDLIFPVSVDDQAFLPDIDFMTAEHLSGTSTKDPDVKLHFHHRLAKVVVNLTTDNESISLLKGATLVMKGLKTKGTYNLLYETLTVDDASGADVTIPIAGAVATGIILPRPEGEGVIFEVTTADGGKYTAAMPSDLELKAGYVHTFHIRLKSPAEISATIEPWIEGPERHFDLIRVVAGLGVTEGFDDGDQLDLFLKKGADADFALLNGFTYDGARWIPSSPVYWESLSGEPFVFRGATVIAQALNDTQMDDILISKDVTVEPYTGINLEMEHAGSKAIIQLISSDGTFTAEDLKNATILLPDYLNSGSYNDKGEFVPGSLKEDITPEDGVAIFPPQVIANGDNILTVSINGRLYEVKAEAAEGFVYEPGTQYTFIVDASKAKVEMSTTIKPWIEETIEFKEIRVGSADLGQNGGDLLDGDQLLLFNGDNTNRTQLPGVFVYDEATDTWTYNGSSAPLYWEDIPKEGSLYGSITRPAIHSAEGNNQSPDYITAEPVVNNGGTDNTALNLTLSHRVAKVNVMLRSTTYDGTKLTSANVSLPDYAIGGRLDKGIYVPGTEKGNILLGKPVKTGEGATVTYNTASYLQPQLIAIGEKLLTVEIDGRTYTLKPEDVKLKDGELATPADILYEAGKVTNLIVTIEKTGVSASVVVTPWQELPALEFEAFFFTVTDKASSGFENGDQIKFYKLGDDGSSVDGIHNVYQYAGGPDHGTLNPVDAPWYRDDFSAGDLITAVYPASASALAEGQSTFEWTAKSSGETNAHADDLMVAAPAADRNLGVVGDDANMQLEFKHLLSKVSINLIAGEGFTPDEIRPAEVEMNNFKLTGTVDVVNGIATATGNSLDKFHPSMLSKVYSVESKTVVSSFEAFVMPQTITANTVMVTIKLNGGVFEAKLPADKLFAAGAHNMLNLTLNKTGVELSASIVDWNKEPDINLDLH